MVNGTMFTKIYFIKIAFLISIMQLSLAVYLAIQGFTDTEFYNRMFEYSIILSLIPIISALLIIGLINITNSYEDHSNGFVNKSNTVLGKNYDSSLYLFSIGFCFLFFNTLFNVFSFPNWTNAIIPVVLAIVILLMNNQKVKIYHSE